MIIRSKNHLEHYKKGVNSNSEYKLSGRKDAITTLNVYTNILKQLPRSKDNIILDIGCGDGMLFQLLPIYPYKEAIGILPSIEEVTCIKNRFLNMPNVSIKKGLSSQLPIDDKSISTVICNGVFLLLKNMDEVKESFKEIKRVCQNDAYIYIGEVMIEKDLPRTSTLTDKINSKWIYFKQLFNLTNTYLQCDAPLLVINEDELINIASSYGLSLIKEETAHYTTNEGKVFFRNNRKNFLFSFNTKEAK